MSPLADDSKPVIVDKNGTQIEPDKDADDTYLGVEHYSGVCLIAMERIFFNMFIFADDLFQNFSPELPEYGYYFPLAFVRRESEWTLDQVDEVYGPLILAGKLKWVFFSLLLFFGLLSLGLATYFGYRYRSIKQTVIPNLEEDIVRLNHASEEFFDAKDRLSKPIGGETRSGAADKKGIL